MIAAVNYSDRTVTEVKNDSRPIPIANLAELTCFVLLAEPGMGKTSVFKAMVELQSAKYITANDFLVISSKPDFNHETCWYIDALDEARVSYGQSVVDAVRSKVSQLNLQRFRLACRVADWDRKNNSEDMRVVAPDGNFPSFILNPLTEIQSRALLKAEGIADPANFFNAIKLNNLDLGIGNPQTLKLFANAFKDNNNALPTSKQDVYRLACSELVREVNRRKINDVPCDQLLNAAGWLGAVLMLSNQKGVSNESSPNLGSNIIAFSDLVFDSQATSAPTIEVVTVVLKRRLFETNNGCSEPTHRTIAEFLAAQYLSRRIAEGLSPSRLSSLLLTEGKTLVSNLRGLAGWLATICEPMREPLLLADPQAILFYGDLGAFGPSARKKLIQELSISHNFGYSRELVSHMNQLGALAHDDMLAFLTDWLHDFSLAALKGNVSEPQETTARVILNVLQSRLLPEPWGPLLNDLVRNDLLKIDIRERALHAMRSSLSNWHQLVMRILDDINVGTLTDSSSKLLGYALQKLYPTHVTPLNVFKYAAANFKSKRKDSTPRFFDFYLQELTRDSDILDLLSALSEEYADYNFYGQPNHQDWRTHLKLGDVIARAILEFGTQIHITKLAQWHGWAIQGYSGQPLIVESPECRVALASWQTENPELTLKVAANRLKNSDPNRGFRSIILSKEVDRSMGLFWLQQAVENSEKHPDKALRYLRNACYQIQHYGLNTNVTLDDIIHAISGSPFLVNELPKLLVSDLGSEENKIFRENARATSRQKIKQANEQQKIQQYFAFLQANIEKIRTAELLDYLANAAWADLVERGAGYLSNETSSAITKRLGLDPLLREATNSGYVCSLTRLAEIDLETIRQSKLSGRRFLVDLPSLLGADLLFAEEPEKFFALNDRQLKVLLALSFEQPRIASWLVPLLQKKPDFCSDTWLAQAKWTLLKTERDIPFLRTVVLDPQMVAIAANALPALLSQFPVKFAQRSLNDFLFVLAGAAANAESASVSEILRSRLAKISVSMVQRVHLLMAGLFVDPGYFVPELENALTTGQVKARSLLAFTSFFKDYFGDRGFSVFSANKISPHAAELLIKVLAPICNPEGPVGAYTPTRFDDTRHFIQQLFRKLGEDFSDQTTEIFDRLLALDLGLWRSWCIGVYNHRRSQKFDHEFSTPSFKEVLETLACRAPASPADLMAICVDLLTEYQQEIKNSDLSLINGFWATDNQGKKPMPPHLPEPQCRNVIAQWLRPKLTTLGVSLGLEALHGDQAEVDLRLTFTPIGKREFFLPVEVKGDWHAELFIAAETQLYKKYATDPSSNGNGIYLVLWTGEQDVPKPNRYKSPVDLQLALANSLKDKKHCSGIRVFVLDISILTQIDQQSSH